MDRYEVMAGKMAPLTDGAHRKWGFTGKVETRSYERLVDALIDFVETGDSLKARFLTGFAACLAADRKSVENRGFGVAVRKVQCHRGAPEGGRTHYGHHEPIHVVHGKALQVGGCRRPHRIRVDGQGTRFACRRARDACRAAMARTMARSRVDTCLGRVKRCFSHALIFAAQVCAIYVVILLSGLLVFWSAIFIDSKGRKFSRQEDSRILRKHHREIGKTMAINRVTVMGNLTRDAELRKKGDATSVLTFGLAINEKKKDSETGEYVDAPVFVDCALFGARAEALAPYLTKGKKVSVDGRLRYHSWMKNEEKRHALSVLVTDIEFADSKGVGKDTVSAKGQSAEPETYDADIPF